METTGYVTLSRQKGLMREMRVVANNIANAATTGFRQEGVIFAEYVRRNGDEASLSIADARAHHTSVTQGALDQTGGAFDLAIQGPGYFMVETEAGERLTRAGSFRPDANGDLVNDAGQRLLDAGGAPVFVPPDIQSPRIAADGTLSDGARPIAQIGVFQPTEPGTLSREDGVLFKANGEVEPLPDASLLQGFLESSNVDPILQVARMIEVQRAYEMGQNFLRTEDERMRGAVQTLMKSS